MQKRTRIHLLILVVLLSLVPLAIYVPLSAKDEKYSQAIARYECAQGPCAADFNGDGRFGNVVIDRTTSPPAGPYPAAQAWLVASDSDRELLRLPYSYADNTLRTHIAIRPDSSGDRLLVFDHNTQGEPLRHAYAWNGKQLVQVEPSAADQEILAALSARDDAGTWNQWVLFRSFGKPLILGFYLLVVTVGLIILGLRKTRRNTYLKSGIRESR
jgi:hypothetical protein